MRGEGRVLQRGGRWWISYYAPKDGRRVERREPAMIIDHDKVRPAKNEIEARRLLKHRRDQVGAHAIGARVFKGPEQEKLPFAELLATIEKDYETKKRSSLPQLKAHLKHVRNYFDGYVAMAVTPDRVREFIASRRREGAAEASIARELEAIRRAFSLAAAEGRINFTPVVPMLSIGDTNARQGFLSRADFEALLAGLGNERGRGREKKLVPDHDLQDFTEFAFWTAMRKGEIASLTWEAFSREAWTLTLAAKDAKTRRPRTIALEGPLREIIERRLQRRRLDVPLVFHRDREPIAEFRKAWASACKRAGLTGVHFHDLRRTGIRNMVRAGVDPSVAKRISGHRTDRTFARYNILDEADIRDAVTKTSAFVAGLPAERKTAALSQGKKQA